MDKYAVRLMSKAERDLDQIYKCIAETFLEIETAESLIDLLEESILSLEEMPYRGAIRKIGVYSDKDYRQIFVKNYTIVYRIIEKEHLVVVVTVRYTPSHF